MQIKEGTAVAAFKEGRGTCPFEPHSKEKGFKGKAPGEKSVAELKKAMTNGWSTKQWNQVGEKEFTKKEKQKATATPRPEFDKHPIKIAGVSYPLSLAAHHIIPGKASLPVSSLKKYLWKDEGVILGDVGYDCDGSENGIWLPTHQSMSRRLGTKYKITDESKPGSKAGLSWEQLSEKAHQASQKTTSPSELFLPRYTQQAMRLTGTQFHDAHSDYNEFVTKKLNKTSTLMDNKIGFCEECKKAKEGKLSPPYLLVYRLNSISAYIATTYLRGQPSKAWKTVYTSRFSQMYAKQPLKKSQLA